MKVSQNLKKKVDITMLGCHNFNEKTKNIQKCTFLVTFLSLLMKIQLQADFKKCHFHDFCHFWPSASISDLYNWFGCCHWVIKLITLSKSGTSLNVRRFGGGVAWKLPVWVVPWKHKPVFLPIRWEWKWASRKTLPFSLAEWCLWFCLKREHNDLLTTPD